MEEPSLLHKRDRIVIEAVQLFDSTGIQGFSTKVLAGRLGISEGTVFKHFRTKNDLLLAMIDHYGQYDEDIARTVILRKLGPADSIRFYMNAYAEYYGNYPAVCSLLLAEEMLAKEPALAGRVKTIFTNRRTFLRFLIERAVQGGFLRTGLDMDLAVDLLSGAERSIILHWRFNGMEYPLKERIAAAVDLQLQAFT